jgi:hypothetical protein
LLFRLKVDPILAPEPGPLARLVDAVRALRNRPFESVALDELEHFRCGSVRHLRKGNVFSRLDYATQNPSAFRERKFFETTTLVDQDVKGVVDDV